MTSTNADIRGPEIRRQAAAWNLLTERDSEKCRVIRRKRIFAHPDQQKKKERVSRGDVTVSLAWLLRRVGTLFCYGWAGIPNYVGSSSKRSYVQDVAAPSGNVVLLCTTRETLCFTEDGGSL